jgi:hypothetical protein
MRMLHLLIGLRALQGQGASNKLMRVRVFQHSGAGQAPPVGSRPLRTLRQMEPSDFELHPTIYWRVRIIAYVCTPLKFYATPYWL